MTSTPIRIAGVQGFYGDSPFGALAIAKAKAADFLVHDALSELTLSILQKDRQRDPQLGYARDIEFLAATLYPLAFSKGIRIVTNSGGLNPLSAAKKVSAILQKKGISGIKIACITGDDQLERIAEMQAQGIPLTNLDTGAAYVPEAKTATHANVYVGAKSIKEALDQGAQLILAGRVADPSLTLGILCHHYNWPLEGELSQAQLDVLAAGTAVGHIIECGGQASGGNAYSEWPMDYRVSNIGYPIAHVHADGTAEFTKAEGSGGKVSRNTIREQLVYEIHDPANYISPDVTVDMTQIQVEEIAENKVRLSGVKGKAAPELLKMTIGQEEGYLTDQFFFFSWPYAYEKAQKFIQAVKETWAGVQLKAEETRFDLVGINGLHGSAAPLPSKEVLDQMNEIGVRVAFKHQDPRMGKTGFQSIIGLALNGPPGLISIPGWGKQNRALLSLWPCLVPRDSVEMKIEMV